MNQQGRRRTLHAHFQNTGCAGTYVGCARNGTYRRIDLLEVIQTHCRFHADGSYTNALARSDLSSPDCRQAFPRSL